MLKSVEASMYGYFRHTGDAGTPAIMNSDHATTHLLSLLREGLRQSRDSLLNNLVYYIPRLQTLGSLRNLVISTFESPAWAGEDLFELFEMTQAIFQWKLDISEPTVSLEEFYDAWDQCFVRCQAWTAQKLALLSGILSTKEKFKILQKSNFVDDSGNVIKMYKRWRNLYFMPVWCSLVCKPQPLTHLDQIVAIYSTISEPSDTKITQLPWDVVTLALTRLSTNYIACPPATNFPFARHLNRFVRTLQISIENNGIELISNVLSALCSECFNLCARELGSARPNRSYSDEYHRNVLFAVVIELKAILDATEKIPENWQSKIIMCLFFTNFIAQDIGVIGFESYEHVYEVATMGITMCRNSLSYMHVLDTMLGNIWREMPHPNKVNDAKLLFILNYMENTIPNVTDLSPQFVDTVVDPLKYAYSDSPDREIRESMHLVVLSLFQNSVSGDDLILWQAQNYQKYIAMFTTNFLEGRMSEKQLAIVFQIMSSRLPLLQAIDRDLCKTTLHYTYLKILNCKNEAQKKVLLLCLIYQLPYVDSNFLVDWLNTCQEVIRVGFDKRNRKEILTILWDIISCMKSDAALKWWYGNVIPSKSLL